MATVQGIGALHRRLDAIGHPRAMLKAIQIAAVNEAQARVPRKTGHLQRSIGADALTDSYAVVSARTPYAAAVEFGTKAHEIRPKSKRALAFPADASGRRLSGRARTNAGRMVIVAKVNHPGTKAHPYLIPGAKAAVEKSGAKDIIVKQWNGAA